MALVNRRIAECYLDGESFIYILFDDVTLDIVHFEVRGDTKSKLSLVLEEPDLKEKINITGKIEQGGEVQVIEPTKKWKMIEVIEDGKKTLKYPLHMKVLASWEAG